MVDSKKQSHGKGKVKSKKTGLGVGKRKTTVARATVRKGSGEVRINGTSINALGPESLKEKAMQPVELIGEKGQSVDIDVGVKGGGTSSWGDAVRTSIANGLAEFFGDEVREIYLETDRSLLVSDMRIKEPKHPLGRGARKKRQKSYR